jgi:hypothetical protein
VSTSTTATWQPNGKVGPPAVNVSAALRPPSAAVAAAMSAQVWVTAGVPATWNTPRSVSSTTSAASASSNPAAICRADSTRASAVTWTAVPPCWSDRDPIVPPPADTRSVSPQTTSIWSIGMPVSDDAIIDHAVM